MNAERFVVSAPAGYLLVTAAGDRLDVALEDPIIAFCYAVDRRAGQAERWTITPITLKGSPIRENNWAIRGPDGKVQETSLSWDIFRNTKEFLAKSDTLRRAREEIAMDGAFAKSQMKRTAA